MIGVDQAAQTASMLANAAQNAGQLEQAKQQATAAGQPAPKTSPFDVLTHTGQGLAQRDLGDQIMASTPAGAMLGLFQTMSNPAHGSAPSAIPAAMGQGWDAVKTAAAGVGQAQGAMATVGAAFGTLVAFEQMLSMAFSAIPFPAFPAVRILDMDIGLPHAHMHPPNLIPPAPPVPLPSTGPVIPIPLLSGASKTLINGMPAARCGDIGLGIWCGGYFPMYEIFLGSSNVWIEGNRAARVGIDITKHCIFTSPKPSDPPVGPMIGFTVTSSANVLIGGIPMPSLLNMAMGKLFKALFKGLGKVFQAVRKRLGKGRAPANNRSCTVGEPINVVTGANFADFEDFRLTDAVPCIWTRHYSSAMAAHRSSLGYGFRHNYDRRLRRLGPGWEYQTEDGETVGFEALDPLSNSAVNDGLQLRKICDERFEIREAGQPVMEFLWDPQRGEGLLSALNYPAVSIKFQYDSLFRLYQIDLPAGRRLELRNDAAGQIKEVRQTGPGPEHRTLVKYSYDAAGNLLAAEDGLGNVARYAYDGQHRMLRNTDRGGYSFHYQYDAEGRCLGSRGDDGLYECRLQYFPAERRTLVTYADGASSTYRYDDQGVLIEVVDPAGQSRLFVVNERGRVQQETDPHGNITEWIYDAWGGNVGRRDPLGYLHGPMHLDPNPPDPLLRQLPRTPMEWECGNLLNRSKVVTLSIDDRLLHACPASVANEFLDGHIVPPLWPDAQSETLCDGVGRPQFTRDDRGFGQKLTYDEQGHLLQTEDRDGVRTMLRYSSWRLPTEMIDANGAHTRYEYTLREYPTRITDAGGTISEYVYNRLDQIVAVRRHGKVREQYEYDEAGNLTTKSDGQGRWLVRWKPGPGNVDVERQLEDGEGHLFQRDRAGRIVAASWAGGKSVTRTPVDQLGRQTADLRNGKGVEHQFDRRRLARTTWFGRFVAEYRWINARLLEIIDPTGGVQQIELSPRGGLLVKRLSNGTSEACQYDHAGRTIRKAIWQRQVDGTDWRRVYHHSAAGELRKVVDSQWGETQYEYDAAHRLIAMRSTDNRRQAWVWDLAGNLLAQPGLEGVLVRGNRLIAANGDSFEYNDRDHVTRRRGRSRNLGFRYNALDQLIECDVGGQPWRAAYDPQGRRTAKSWQGKTTEYYWDGDRLAAELSEESLRIYIYADENALVPFMFVDYAGINDEPSSGRAYFLFTNQIGVPLRVENNRGEAVWRAEVEPFGRLQLDLENSISLALRFPGHFFDPETGLHYNRHRYYDPELGRYLASDPTGIAGGINLYGYATNPLRDVDLIGLSHGGQQGAKPPGAKGEAPTPAPAGGGLQFGPNDLVYGPSARGQLRALQQKAGGQLLTDFPYPPGGDWLGFSKQTMNSTVAAGNKIHFDLTHMDDLPNAIAGKGPHGGKVTAGELRHLRDNWGSNGFNGNNTKFYKDGVEVPPPW